MTCLAVMLLTTLAAGTAPAQDQRDSSTVEVEVGSTFEDLSGGYADWWSVYVELIQKFPSRTVVYGVLQETSRLSLEDQQVLLGSFIPLGREWTAYGELTLSPSHAVLPIWSFDGRVQFQFAKAWLVHGGLRHTRYTPTTVTQEIVLFEYYWAAFRAASTTYLTQVPRAGGSLGSHIALSYYYSDRNSIGIGLAVGREVESLGPQGVASSTVQGLNGTGRHWVSPKWAVGYQVIFHKQGHHYVRKGIQLGIRYVP